MFRSRSIDRTCLDTPGPWLAIDNDLKILGNVGVRKFTKKNLSEKRLLRA